MSRTNPLDLHNQAVAAFQQKDWRHAYDLSVQCQQLAPNHAKSFYIAGLAAVEMRLWQQALAQLHKATQLAPGEPDYAAQFAKALSVANMPGEAVRMANKAMSLAPTEPSIYDHLGIVYTHANLLERAACAFRRAAELVPDNPEYRYNYATSLMYVGNNAQAEEEYEACLALDPTYWRAYFSLPRLRRQTPENNHIDRMLALAGEHPGDNDAQMFLHMALSKEYEDLGDYPCAFEHIIKGKTAGGNSRTNPDRHDQALFEAITHQFPEPWPQPAGFPTDEPIFVVGMPRTGTTLVERIISSHPYVHSAGELQNFGIAVKQASGSPTDLLLDLDTLGKSRNLRWDQLGERYLSSTRPITDGKPRFIDKLPHNFLYIGHIANALPNAKIICLRRNALDTCLSNFRELFTRESAFYGYSFDLLDIGRYYIQFDRLMTHWKRVLPGRVLEVAYEAVVGAQEENTRKMLEYCGLPWHDACLQFDRNKAAVSTASAVQVRAPIHRNSLQRWRKYEPQLAGLRELLEAAGIALGS